MRNCGRNWVSILAALVICVARPCVAMADTLAGGVATGDETPIIAAVLCVVGVVIIIVALKKRK